MSPFLLQHNQHRWPQNNFSFPFLKAQCVRETAVIYIPNVILHRGDVLGHVLQSRQVLWQELLPEDRQQPEDWDPQIGNHFPTRIKEQFGALTTTRLYLRVQEGASRPIPILTTSHRRVGFGLAEERGEWLANLDWFRSWSQLHCIRVIPFSYVPFSVESRYPRLNKKRASNAKVFIKWSQMFGSQLLLPAKGIKIKIHNGTLLGHPHRYLKKKIWIQFPSINIS